MSAFQHLRRPELFEQARQVFRFPRFESTHEPNEISWPAKRPKQRNRPNPVRCYPGVLFEQQGPL